MIIKTFWPSKTSKPNNGPASFPPSLTPFWTRPVEPRHLDDDIEDAAARLWFLKQLRQRNFPPPGQAEQNTIILISGDLRSSKSTIAAKLILGCNDLTYLKSLEYHQANGGHSGDDWRCHLSVSPGPFIDAVEHELSRVKEGKPQEYLVRGSWWHFDEPSKMKSTEWWTQLAKDVSDTIMENAFLGINAVICTPMRGRVLSLLRDLSNYWIRMYRLGWGMVHDFHNRINYKSAGRPEIRVPKGLCPITDDIDPRDHPLLRKWNDLYMPIKIWNAQAGAVERAARWKETKKKETRKRTELVQPLRARTYVS